MSQGRIARYSRSLVSVIALAASLAALVLVVQNHRAYWFGHARDGGLSDDLTSAEGHAARASALVSPAEDSRYRALSDSVSRRYRVSQEMAYDLVQLAHNVGRQHGLDPLLIIAVIAIESRFNPIAESMSGAKGLMQIIPKYHTDKLEEYGGEKAVFDPVANVKVGSSILKDYVRLTGNLSIALQMYAGALGDGDDQYTNRVMNEQRRLKRVLSLSAGEMTRTSSGTQTAAASSAALTRQ
jgi:soluble lytic murein transglycosylase-like protein